MTITERKQINRDFVIRITINNKTNLIGAGQLYKVIPEMALSKLVQRITKGSLKEYTYWDRKSITVKFIPK
jgi:hypothetical protein